MSSLVKPSLSIFSQMAEKDGVISIKMHTEDLKNERKTWTELQECRRGLKVNKNLNISSIS